MEAFLIDNEIVLKNSFKYRHLIKSIPGRRWNPEEKTWNVPLTIESIDTLKYVIDLEGELLARYNDLKKEDELIVKQDTDDKPIKPMPIKVKPFMHQVQGYNKALKEFNKGCGFGLLFEMGCGKTLTAIAIVSRLFLDNEVKKILIVAPLSVVPVWAKEFETFANVSFTVENLEGSAKDKVSKLNQLNCLKKDVLKIAVINYESTWRIYDELKLYGADMIICDESQRIKNARAKQSKALHKLGEEVKFKLILSGTPIQNNPLDIFSQYKFLNKNVFGTSFYAFRAKYAEMGGYGGKQIVAYKNIPELTKRTHSIALRVTKADALDLPETVDVYRYCTLEKSAKKVYEEIRKENYAALCNNKEITTTNILTRLLRLQQIAGGFVGEDQGTIQQISNGKLKLLYEILEDVVIENNKKLVIFARFIPEIKAILKLLDKEDIFYSYITGGVKNRKEQVDLFQEDKNCKVFIAQIQTAGLGITLHAADTAVFYSVDFNLANYLQAKARTHRIGQKNKCTYIHLLAKNTVDERIMEALKKKENIAKTVVDNWKEYLRR